MPPGAFRTSGFPSGRLIRLLGDGGHYRNGISGVLLNSKLTNPEFVGTGMTLGKWKVGKCDCRDDFCKSSGNSCRDLLLDVFCRRRLFVRRNKGWGARILLFFQVSVHFVIVFC